MIKVVSFDIGGTLVKVTKAESVIQKLFAITDVSIDLLTSAYAEHFIKKTITLDQFCQKTNIADEKDVIDIVDNYYQAKVLPQVYDDVTPTLDGLKKRDILIMAISNKSYKNPFHLHSYGLDHWFCEEIYSYDAGYAKPDVNIFRYAERLVGAKPNEILHIGDSMNSDYRGAQKASWNSVILNRRQIPYDNAEIYAIDSLKHVILFIDICRRGI